MIHARGDRITQLPDAFKVDVVDGIVWIYCAGLRIEMNNGDFVHYVNDPIVGVGFDDLDKVRIHDRSVFEFMAWIVHEMAVG